MFSEISKNITRMDFFRRQQPLPSQELDNPWRSVDWSEVEKQKLLKTLNDFKIGNQDFTLRILLHGPVGAGKSSFLNSVDTALQGRNSTRALADSTSGRSFTMEYKQFKLRKTVNGSDFPFVFTDLRGMEYEKNMGVHPEDIIKILQGHVKNGYKCNAESPITEGNPKYNENPSLNDRIHCLVAVLPACSISLMEQNVIDQLRKVREKARDLGIPQVIIMTKVDEVCPLVKDNLEKIYTSKKIKEKMEQCSFRLGVPVNFVFPVKNYHEEDAGNTKMDILLFKALLNIVYFAKDYVEDQIDNE